MLIDHRIGLFGLATLLAASLGLFAALGMAGPKEDAQIRAQAKQLQKQGNWKEALAIFRRLAENASTDSGKVHEDLHDAVLCLNQLGLIEELDPLLKTIVDAHSKNWRVLSQSAEEILQAPHHGIILANAFHRAPQSFSAGVWTMVADQDRHQALIWLHQALPLIENESDQKPKLRCYSQLARTILDQRNGRSAWLLQSQTNLEKNPDYLDVESQGYIQVARFAPVDANGQPIYFSTVDRWDQAVNDGQRLRWAIDRWSAIQSTPAQLFWAEFLSSQFGVETLSDDRLFFRVQASFGDDNAKDNPSAKKAATFGLHTLEDSETIARLANGIQRFTLTDQYNPIHIYRQLIQSEPKNGAAYRQLVEIYTNRRQYSKAADICRQAIEARTNDNSFKQSLDSMVLPRGRFDIVESQPAGKPATLGFIFRNADQASFSAAKVDIEKLLTDIKQFYKNHRPDQQPNFGGQRQYPPRIEEPSQLFSKIKIDQYLQGTVAEWKLDLQPRENHWDRRVQVATPLQQPGLYVVTAKLQKPDHIARCLVWIHDTSIVRKQLDNKILYMVADAITGLPIPNANVEFFGFAHEYNNNGRPLPVKIANFAKKTSSDGQIILDANELPANYQWQVTARASENRLASLGMEHLWFNAFSQQDFQQWKAYGVADRPAYRPGEIVKAKFWVALAGYGLENDASADRSQAGKNYSIQLIDPQGTALWTGSIETDRLGGGSVELTIPKEAKLGAYRFQVQDGSIPTSLVIRVEEYRKPEFEVLIEAPKTPIQLGEKFKAVVRAKYYFGSPVAGSTANVKVTRTAFQDAYFPIRPFDWCYGPGYWWTAYDLDWYPGWRRWAGCFRPVPWWLPRIQEEPPELVLQQEVELDSNGESTIEIDSSLALAFQSDSDHRYKIEVDVRDASRRTNSQSGEVIAARQAFKIYSWSDRGFYQTDDRIQANFQARTLGRQSVTAKGTLELLRITYDATREPIESLVDSWNVATNDEGDIEQTLQAGRPGQYRLKLTLTDDAEHTVEGGYLITIRGNGMQGTDFRFSALELIPDRNQYTVGDKVRLQINADRDDALVWLFIRPQGSVYPIPQRVQLVAKSAVIEIPLAATDQPNFFVEAITIYDGDFHQEAREIIVPPVKRVLNVSVEPSKSEYLPGEEAEVKIEVRDMEGKPVEGSAVLAVYDRSLEQIAPDALPPDIREFFWKWRRQHFPQAFENLSRRSMPVYMENMPSADPLGIFGHSMADDADSMALDSLVKQKDRSFRSSAARGGMATNGMLMEGLAMPRSAAKADSLNAFSATVSAEADTASGPSATEPPKVRKDFADAAYWIANVHLNSSGQAVAKFKMPENLTSWQIGVWSMADGVRVGSGNSQALTRKNLMVRLQAPRFLVDRDEVVVSGLINNEFNDPIEVEVTLNQSGDLLRFLDLDSSPKTLVVPAHGQKRVDWRCRAVKSGEAILRVTATSPRESDAMELKLPVVVNGILKTESFAGTVRPNQPSSTIEFQVPEQRIVEHSKLMVRLSPSLAMSMVDALPYLVDYPHGCTEQTLNRFVPTVITHQTLKRMGIDLRALQEKRVNLNAQELGDPAVRAARWKRFDRNPVFDNDEVGKMVEVGLRRLTEMQLSDGGWGWFSGLGEHSWPHTTAVVVRGLQAAQAADAAIVPDCLNRGLDWLARYQDEQILLLRNAATKKRPYKIQPDDLDAFVFHILVNADRASAEMQSFLYEKRNQLSVHSKALLALATHRLKNDEQTKMLRQNIEQFLVQDAENETTFLRDQSAWWYWYGSPIEATALYLKLLSRIEPQSPIAPRLVKYLLNNRKHANYWNSTRDTALVVESFAEFLSATGEGSQEVQAEVLLDDQSIGNVRFSPRTLFETNNTIELVGNAIPPGRHRLQLRRQGQGSLYWNVYQTNFTLEEEITAAGLEVKIDRRYYRLNSKKKEIVMAGDRGQLGEGERAAYDRVPLTDSSEVQSGQLIEVELLIESKNDYEYIMLHDSKAASFEPIDTNSGYTYQSGLSVYREFRDQYVGMFLRSLPRGTHSIRYQLRSEAPGRFTALPATVLGMYAPELVGNSADFDVNVVE